MRSRSGNLVDASEADLIKYVLAQCRRLYDFFGFVVDPAIGFPREGWDYRILCNVDRDMLGLDPALKPGDIDIIIVPTKADQLFVEYAMAVEVKRLYLPLNKRWRDTNSSGITQARGLLRDGFPFVGILHLVLAETSPRTEWQKVMTARIVGDNGEAEIVDDDARIDPVIWTAPTRQLGRLAKQLGPSAIGLNSVFLTLNEGQTRIIGMSTQERRVAQENPNKNTVWGSRLAWLCLNIRNFSPPEMADWLKNRAKR